MLVYRVYTDERSDRPFSESLLISVIVLAENENDAKLIVLNRYTLLYWWRKSKFPKSFFIWN